MLYGLYAKRHLPEQAAAQRKKRLEACLPRLFKLPPAFWRLPAKHQRKLPGILSTIRGSKAEAVALWHCITSTSTTAPEIPNEINEIQEKQHDDDDVGPRKYRTPAELYFACAWLKHRLHSTSKAASTSRQRGGSPGTQWSPCRALPGSSDETSRADRSMRVPEVYYYGRCYRGHDKVTEQLL